MGDVTLLLERARSGDESAWDQAVALVYSDLKDLARGMLGGRSNQSLNVTSLVHEFYLRIERKGAVDIENRKHLMALASRAMRQLMVSHARERLAQKRGGGQHHTTLSAAEDLAIDHEAEQLLALDEALIKLASDDLTAARIIECRVFAGMTDEESAAALELPLRKLQRGFADAKRQLEILLAT
jgi:RNA polymerase sigma factor (TIGR02999 family)